VNCRSPMYEWLTPTVVDSGLALGAVPSKRKAKCVIGPTPLTATGILTPAGSLSGIGTAGPVKLKVVKTHGVGVGVGVGLGVGLGHPPFRTEIVSMRHPGAAVD
jgi:hypothetical protein